MLDGIYIDEPPPWSVFFPNVSLRGLLNWPVLRPAGLLSGVGPGLNAKNLAGAK